MKHLTTGRLGLAALTTCAVALSSASSAAAAPLTAGIGAVDPTAPGTFVPVTVNGQSGRLVALTGAITGTDFEPGICNAGPALASPCFQFTNTTPQPGQFERAHNGQTSFTYCNPCTIGGKTGSFTIKITYPNPFNGTTAKTTIQNAAGGLAGLQGYGTVDLTTLQYTVNYAFT